MAFTNPGGMALPPSAGMAPPPNTGNVPLDMNIVEHLQTTGIFYEYTWIDNPSVRHRAYGADFEELALRIVLDRLKIYDAEKPQNNVQRLWRAIADHIKNEAAKNTIRGRPWRGMFELQNRVTVAINAKATFIAAIKRTLQVINNAESQSRDYDTRWKPVYEGGSDIAKKLYGPAWDRVRKGIKGVGKTVDNINLIKNPVHWVGRAFGKNPQNMLENLQTNTDALANVLRAYEATMNAFNLV